MNKKQYKVGIYSRLSRDDNNGNLESMSIENQKLILSDYVKEKGWEIVDFYIDDGFTGTNFNRPDFKRLIRDIELGAIDCVITKDLSRLGRNYSMTGYYTDEYFPEHNVRYIAINDGVDTMGNNNDFAAFHNVINEYYPRDISRKVKQVKRSKAAKGLFMGSHTPYGYKRSHESKYQLIIDDKVSNTVKRIFTDFISGVNARTIADNFNNEKIQCPIIYRYINLEQNVNPKYKDNLWGSGTVMSILSNQVYIGNMVQGKRRSVSFKSHKRRVTTSDEWIVVENTHEPIVDKEIWQMAQKYRSFRRPRNNPNKKTESIFAGLLRCSDCNSSMIASTKGTTKLRIYYQCSKYTNCGKDSCNIHSIREDILEEIVLNDIHSFAKLAKEDEVELIQKILKAIEKEDNLKCCSVQRQLYDVEKKHEETSVIIRNLYKDKVDGKISDSIFSNLMSSYEQELKNLEAKIPELQSKLRVKNEDEENIRKFTKLIEGYLSFDKLTRSTARMLIDNIVVHDHYEVDGEKMQDIEISYRFVGNLEKLLKQSKKAA